MAAPPHRGDLADRNGARCVVCPWRRSVFRLSGGAVVWGSATAPQPVLEHRAGDRRLEVKVRAILDVPAS